MVYATRDCCITFYTHVMFPCDFIYLWLCFYVFAFSKYTLWQFQNGKLGQFSPKIDQDTTHTTNDLKPQF